MAKTKETARSIQCHVCKVETEHKLLCHREKRGEEVIKYRDYGPNETASWSVNWDVYQCTGCKELVVRRVGNHDLADYPNEDFFPPRPSERTEQTPTPPKWTSLLPDGMESLFEEIYTALGNKSYRLVAMGLRSLMDALMNHAVGDIGGFEQKAERMQEKGLLSDLQQKVLDPTLELGHATIHRGHSPSGSQVDAALNVVESLLELFFVQKKAIERLKEGVKPRRKRKKKKQKPNTGTNGKVDPTGLKAANPGQAKKSAESGKDPAAPAGGK